MNKMYPFKNCGMELLKVISNNYEPDYSIELLERIERDFNKALEMSKDKGVTYSYHNHTRLIKILWKLGFITIHDFQSLLNKKRQAQKIEKGQDIERKRLGLNEKVEVSKVKQEGNWLYQELKIC